MSKADKTSNKQFKRLLDFLHSARSATLSDFGRSDEGRVLLTHPDQPIRKMVTTRQVIDSMLAQELLVLDGCTCRLTSAGTKRVLRQRSRQGEGAEFRCQHQQIVQQQILLDGQRHSVSRNLAESPLSRLRYRTGKDGQPWLSAAQFSAGERLRQDFTHAQLSASVRSNWRSPVQAIGRSANGGGGGPAAVDLSDSALDARRRFNLALEHVGPDLANVLIDVCCYLKGLQTVERELRWPPRSAKLMLRTGLTLLTQFYGTEAGQYDRNRSKAAATASARR
ncbi:MAG: DUF6456 domain-containing protein [Rhizobiaceae bacterium]